MSENNTMHAKKSLLSIIYPDKSDDDIEIIKYGLDVIIGNATKIIVLFTTAIFLGILKYVVFSLVSFNVIRYFASGIHARKHITCMISSLFIFIGSVYMSKYVSFGYADITVAFIVCVFLTYFYAPADTEEKPIVNKALRRELKIKSIAAVLFLYAFTMLTKGSMYADICVFTSLAACIMTTPIIYALFKRRYNNYEYYERKKEF